MFSQSCANRLFKAAACAGVNVRLEFPDGTVMEITGSASTEPLLRDANSDLDKWIREHHEDST
jgi:hypothetical protein